LKFQQLMSEGFRPNTASALFLDSPSPTLPVPPHIPEPFPMPVPTSPQLPVVRLPTIPPPPPVESHISPVPSPLPPALPPTTLTHLEKRAIKACRTNNIIRSESEGSGEDDGKKADEVVDEKVGEVEGPINMSEPWIEGPKSAKVSLTSARALFFFLMFLSIKNCRSNTVTLGLLVSFTRMTKRPQLLRTLCLGNPQGFPRLSARLVTSRITPVCG
jgi:hypothetical protein